MNNNRSKSTDFLSTISSMDTRSSKIYMDEFYRIDREEKELNQLNQRFSMYLNRIIHLSEMNINLRQQINDIHQNYMDNLLGKEFNNIQQKLNNETGQLILYQTRLQRAIYDKKYYKNQLQLFSTNDQFLTMKQQLNSNLYELNLLKEQYKKQMINLQLYKIEYDEYTMKLLEYTDIYNRIVFQRIESEYSLCTLKEQFVFEREKNLQCKEEWEYLEKIQDELNDQLTKKEFENIMKKIRHDYQNYNEIQLSELEIFYKNKFQLIENYFHQNKKENIKPLFEENQQFQQKLKQLEDELRHIIEENQCKYDTLNSEYDQIEMELSKFQISIENSRNNTIDLRLEIDTYRGLLKNLVDKPKYYKTNFIVHFGNGIIWCRI